MGGKRTWATNSGFSGSQSDLFADNREPADDVYLLAEKLFELSGMAHSAVLNAALDESFNRKDLILYAQKVFDAAAAADRECGRGRAATAADKEIAVRAAAETAACNRGDPLVRAVLESAQRVGHEVHRLLGLLRFNPLDNGLWLARCAPDNAILPVMAEHFTLRFGDEPWAIIDEKRGQALVRLTGKEAVLGPLSSFLLPELFDAPKDEWEKLWRGYHRTVCIENRKNPNLQAQFMPRRYWKYLPEVNRQIPVQ
jgi:probable DNA metabolism protein